LTTQAEQDDSDIYSMLWDGLTGYAPPSGDVYNKDYRIWAKRIEEEWIDTMEAHHEDDDSLDKSNEWLVGLLNEAN
jgi:hypothetical protein